MTPTRLTKPSYSITKDDWVKAEELYGACNCGPTALATMLNLTAMEVIPHLNGYKGKHYVNPTMMKQALTSLGVKFHDRFRRGHERDSSPEHVLCEYGLIRIQWCGPWTEPAANPRWAYRQTHWIGSMRWAYRQTHWIGSMQYPNNNLGIVCVFDVNSGWTSQLEWETKTVPKLVEMYPRANGQWFATHRLELEL